MDLQGFNPVARPLLTASVFYGFLDGEIPRKNLENCLDFQRQQIGLLQAKDRIRIAGGLKSAKPVTRSNSAFAHGWHADCKQVAL